MARNVLLHTYNLAYASTGSATITDNLDPIDLSGFDSLTLVARLTVTDTDAADSCVVKLQSTWGREDTNIVWDDRARLASFTGDMSASASSPEVREATVQQHVNLDTTEEAHAPTGSLSGGSALAAGTVENGAFPGVRWTSTGRFNAWRLNIGITDADSDGTFTGAVYVYGLSKGS